MKNFDSFSQMQNYSENANDLELQFLVDIVNDYNNQIPKYVKKIKNEVCHSKEQADVILSTLHRAKGLEYEQLILEDDFLDLNNSKKELNSGERTLEEIEEEINIIYVALTRAKGNIELNKKLESHFGEHHQEVTYEKARLDAKSLKEQLVDDTGGNGGSDDKKTSISYEDWIELKQYITSKNKHRNDKLLEKMNDIEGF